MLTSSPGFIRVIHESPSSSEGPGSYRWKTGSEHRRMGATACLPGTKLGHCMNEWAPSPWRQLKQVEDIMILLPWKLQCISLKNESILLNLRTSIRAKLIAIPSKHLIFSSFSNFPAISKISFRVVFLPFFFWNYDQSRLMPCFWFFLSPF